MVAAHEVRCTDEMQGFFVGIDTSRREKSTLSMVRRRFQEAGGDGSSL
jgi:hypothetical protein